MHLLDIVGTVFGTVTKNMVTEPKGGTLAAQNHHFPRSESEGPRLYTRREAIRKGGLMLVTLGLTPTMLAACGGSSAATTTTVRPGSTTGGGSGAASGTIDFLSWEGYDLPDIMTPWLEANNIDLNPTYPGNHDEITAKLVAGGEGFDIFTYYQGYKDLYTQQELLTPIDESRVPNLDGVFDFFASDVGNYWVAPDGTRTGVPWTWSINALTYDSAAVDAEPQSYYDILDSQYSDRVVVVDDPLGAFTIGCVIFGYDIGALTPDQMAEVSDLLGQFLGQARSVAPSYGDATSQLVSGEAAFVFPGWAAMNSFAAEAGSDTVAMAIPEEGGMATTDAWAIPPGADNADAAYAWMNQTLDPEINAKAANYLVGGTVVEASVSMLSDENKAAYPYYDDIEATFSNVKLNGIPPQESDEFMTNKQMVDEWTALRAGA